MASTSTQKTKLVSARELTRVVEAAVKSASSAGIAAETGSKLVKWDGKILGRIVRDKTLQEKFTADVTAAVRKAGIDAQPAQLIIGKDILCGFVERIELPNMREL